jgi:hypothetical protein
MIWAIAALATLLADRAAATAANNDNCHDCASCTDDAVIAPIYTSIAANAFNGCALTSIAIHDSVTTIGSEAFRDCTSLSAVTMGDSLTSVASDAFQGTTSLSYIEFFPKFDPLTLGSVSVTQCVVGELSNTVIDAGVSQIGVVSTRVCGVTPPGVPKTAREKAYERTLKVADHISKAKSVNGYPTGYRSAKTSTSSEGKESEGKYIVSSNKEDSKFCFHYQNVPGNFGKC